MLSDGWLCCGQAVDMGRLAMPLYVCHGKTLPEQPLDTNGHQKLKRCAVASAKCTKHACLQLGLCEVYLWHPKTLCRGSYQSNKGRAILTFSRYTQTQQ